VSGWPSTIQIKRAKLLPFGDDDQRIGAFGAFVFIVALGQLGQHLYLLHATGS
jgi:hypothetical protein